MLKVLKKDQPSKVQWKKSTEMLKPIYSLINQLEKQALLECPYI
jgi:hypothetical protein